MAEHAVIASYRLSGDEFGSSGEWEGIFRLEDRLAAAIDAAGVGESTATSSAAGGSPSTPTRRTPPSSP
jgi:hypothetical protein